MSHTHSWMADNGPRFVKDDEYEFAKICGLCSERHEVPRDEYDRLPPRWDFSPGKINTRMALARPDWGPA